MELSDHKPVGLTGRYVNALFELCSEKRIIQNVVSDLDNLKRLMFEDQYFKTLIMSPTIGKKKKANVISDILNKLGANKITINFCGVLAYNGRITILTKIIDDFLLEVSRRNGEIKVEVFTAYPLQKQEETSLKNIILEKISRKNISLLTHIDNSLLGGVILKIGSKMIDNSIKTKLKNLEVAMKGDS